LAGVGLLKILHSIQAFKQFRAIRDISDEFVAKKMNIFATVSDTQLRAVRTSGLSPVLLVEHVPLARLPRTKSSSSDLPVTLAAVLVPPDHLVRSAAERLLEEACKGQKVKIQLMERQLGAESDMVRVLYDFLYALQLYIESQSFLESTRIETLYLENSNRHKIRLPRRYPVLFIQNKCRFLYHDF
jgi:hypothetical protein